MKITTVRNYVEWERPILNTESHTYTMENGMTEIEGRVSLKKINSIVPKNASITGIYRETLEYPNLEAFENESPCVGGTVEINIKTKN